MKGTPGPLAGELRGSMGCIVATRNRYGAYFRVRVKPTVSTTEYATEAKARLATCTSNWHDLTAAQKLAWNEYAQGNPVVGSLGEQQILTGHVAYVGIGVRRMMAGSAALVVPPIIPPPDPLTALSVTADIGAGNVELVYTATPTPADEVLWIEACLVNSSGINYVENLMRFIGFSGAAEASPYDIEAAVTARIGAPQVGQTMHVRVRMFNFLSGLVSVPLRARVIVTTT